MSEEVSDAPIREAILGPAEVAADEIDPEGKAWEATVEAAWKRCRVRVQMSEIPKGGG